MPKTHRTQVLLTDETVAKVTELADISRRSMSAMCSELIEYALDHGFSENTGVKAGLTLTTQQKAKLLKLLDAID